MPRAWRRGGAAAIPLAGLFLILAILTVIGFAGVYHLLTDQAGPWAAAGVALALVAPFRIFELHAAGLFPAYAAGCVFPWALGCLATHRGRSPPGRKVDIPTLFGLDDFPGGHAVAEPAPFSVLAMVLVSVWLVLETAWMRRLDTLIRVVTGAAAAMGISAFYLVPRPGRTAPRDAATGRTERLCRQFLFMLPGTWADPALQHLFQRMVLFPLAPAVAVWWCSSAAASESPPDGQPSFSVLLRLLAAITGGAVVLASCFPLAVGENIPALATMQLPWRLLDHLTAPLSAITVLAWQWRRPVRSGWVRYAFAGLCLTLTLLMGALSLSCVRIDGFAPHRIVEKVQPSDVCPAIIPSGSDDAQLRGDAPW